MVRIMIPILLTTVLAFCWTSVRCQIPKKDLFFYRYGSDQGLNTREVRNMVQTSDGLIWMATEEGLYQYDGEEFVLCYDHVVSTEISNSRYIKSMILDDQDRIWLAFTDQLAVYETRSRSWQYLRDSTGDFTINPLRIEFDRQRRMMWIGSGRGLCYADQFLNLSWFSFQDTIYNRLPYIVLGLQNDTAVWLGNTLGYYRLNPLTGQMKEFHTPHYSPEKYNGEAIISAYMMGDSILWMGGWGTGLIKHDLRNDVSTQYYFSDPLKDLNAIFDITKAGIDEQRDWLWVGTIKGLMAFNMLTGKFLPYYTGDPFDFRGVTGAVYSFLHDTQGALWIGSSDGLFRYDPGKQGIDNILLPSFGHCMPIDNIAFEKQEGRPERIWFTIPYCDWHIYNLVTKTIEPFPELLQIELKDVGIFTMFIDHRNRLWIGTNERGLLVYDIRTDQFTSYSGKFFLGNSAWVTGIYEDPFNRIWIATFNGLFQFDVVREEFIEIEPVRKLIDAKTITGHINAITSVDKDHIWAITHYGKGKSGSLICYESNLNGVRVYDRSNIDKFKRIHEFRDIVTAHNGSLFITTDLGLFSIENGDISQLRDFPEFAIHPGPSTMALAVDQNDGIWVSYAFGISRLNQENNTMFSYNYRTSLLGQEPSPSMWFDAYTRKVYVAQIGGIDVIETSPPSRKPVVLNVMDFYINQIKMDTQSRVLHKLKHQQNDVKIRLALPYYVDSGTNQFRYRLDGYDVGWRSSNHGTITYHNLPPGQYTFHAIGITSEGQQSINTITLPFYIQTPFWRTWWFQGAILAFFALGMMAIFLYREHQRKRVQQMRDAIARDLHDDMGSNLSTIKLLSEFELLKNPDEKQQTLKTILDKTNLVMESMYDIIWNINDGKGYNDDLLERIKSNIIHTLEPLDIRIHFDLAPGSTFKEWNLTMDQKRQVLLIFKEAVNNISKYAMATTLEFKLEMEKGDFIFTLKDNGIGFDLKAIHQGNGLYNMMTRAQFLKGELKIESEPGMGTCIQFRLPRR